MTNFYKERDSLGRLMLTGIRSTEKIIRVPEGIQVIDENAFLFVNCKEIYLPQSVVGIADKAFYTCGAEKISIPDSVKEIGSGAFAHSHISGRLVLPEGIDRIPNSAFSHCERLTELVIPDSVKTIDKNAFRNCVNLERVSLGTSVCRILDQAFKNCVRLREIRLPEGMKVLGNAVFEGCMSLEELLVPDGVQQVLMSNFLGCSSLRRLRCSNLRFFSHTSYMNRVNEPMRANCIASAALLTDPEGCSEAVMEKISRIVRKDERGLLDAICRLKNIQALNGYLRFFAPEYKDAERILSQTDDPQLRAAILIYLRQTDEADELEL